MICTNGEITEVWRVKSWHYILLIALALGLYANTIGHEYVLDDKAIITMNKFTQQGFSGIGDHFTHSYWYGINGKDAGNYRPISGVSFSIEKGLFGDAPFAGHLLNILFYALTVFVVFKWLLGLKFLDDSLLFLAMLIFVTHPVHTEVVANIKSRDEIYCLLFFAWSARHFWLWLETKTSKHIILASVLYFVSLLSKETSIALLPIFPLMAMLSEQKLVSAIKKSIVPLGVSGIYLGIYLSVTDVLVGQEYHVFDNALMQEGSATAILATKFWIVGEYISLLFIPHPLLYDYSFNTIPLASFADPQTLIAIALIIALFVWRILQFRRRSDRKQGQLAIAIGLLVLPMVPVTNFLFPIGATMAERFLFIPSLGFSILLVFFIEKLLIKVSLNKPIIIQGIVALIAVVFAISTIERNKDWEREETLFASDLQYLPNNAKAHHNLANIYKSKAETATNQAQRVTFYESAARLLEQAIGIYEVQEFHHELGLIYGELGKWEGVKKSLGQYVKMNPKDATAWMQIGIANGITEQIEEALSAFEQAYTLDPGNAEICLNLAKTYAMQNRIAEAHDLCQRCLETHPNNEELKGLIVQLSQSL